MEDNTNRSSRRDYLAKVGAGISTIPLLTSAVSAKRNGKNITRIETENGIFISTTHSSGLVRSDIRNAREEVIHKNKTGNQSVFLSDLKSVVNNEGPDKKIGYYLGWVNGTPTERLWSAPPTASEKEKEYKLADAQKTVLEDIEAKSRSASIASAGTSSVATTSSSFTTASAYNDGISASPSWTELGTVANDAYAVVTVNGSEYTLGRVDVTGRLYEAGEVGGDRQLGCVLSFLQWPGNYLDNYDSSVSNGVGFNIETFAQQDWMYGGRHNISTIDFAPSNNRGGGSYQAVNLESVTFGADASGPYGSVTLSPNDESVDKVINETDPDVEINTRYEYGGILNAGAAGGNSVVRAGNSGVFRGDWKDDAGNILSCRAYGTFRASIDDSMETEKVKAAYVFSGY